MNVKWDLADKHCTAIILHQDIQDTTGAAVIHSSLFMCLFFLF